MLSSPLPQEASDAAALRGSIFTQLDRLAFALEMEAAALIEKGESGETERTQGVRLGVRLAQRLVSGVWAEEVDPRLLRWADEYERRLAAPLP